MSQTNEPLSSDEAEDETMSRAEASESEPSEAGSETERTLHEATERASHLADRLKRVEAEFVNESKRLRRQTQTDKRYAIERVIIDLLPLIDSVHTGIAALGDTEADARMREGLELIGKQLLEILGRHGVAPIEADGQVFDPTRHQALFTQPRDDVAPQTVVSVLRPGFTLNDRVVRAAEVAVSMAPPEASAGSEATEPAEEGER